MSLTARLRLAGPDPNRSEALDNIRDAIQGYLESLKTHNEPIPPPISEEMGPRILRTGA